MAVSILLSLQFLSVRASTELVSYISVCTISHSLWGGCLFPWDLCRQWYWLTPYPINDIIDQLTVVTAYWSCVPFVLPVSGESIWRQPHSGEQGCPARENKESINPLLIHYIKSLVHNILVWARCVQVHWCNWKERDEIHSLRLGPGGLGGLSLVGVIRVIVTVLVIAA